jgi:histidinol phosphatase-like PHP family hydrolase
MKTSFLSNRFVLLIAVFSLVQAIFLHDSHCQTQGRREVRIPDIPGYSTMNCDFHIHTVFSDGTVWPTTRADEAWLEGLDAFSITDHIDYRTHKADIPSNNFNMAYEIAQTQAQALGIILVRGIEIKTPVPFSHLNAIFLKDASKVNTESFDTFMKSVGYLASELPTELFDTIMKSVGDQDAFVVYNHPGWNQSDPRGVWHPFHTELLEKGLLHGIEIVNGNDYYPLAHMWALEKKLTMIAGSDVHNPVQFDYNFSANEHRPLTLVFVKKKTPEALREALFSRRTVVYWKDTLIGEEKYLQQIFNESIEILNPDVTIMGNEEALVQIRNNSEIPFQLSLDGVPDGVSAPSAIVLLAEKTVAIPVKATSATISGKKRIKIPYKVKNLLIAPDTSLKEEITVTVRFVPPETR